MSVSLPTLNDEEELGRGIFQKHHKIKASRGTIIHKIFLERPGVSDISVDRLAHASLRQMVEIGDRSAQSRGSNRNFYGWAVLSVEAANKDGRLTIAEPLLDNPYHAIIKLPSFIEEEARDEEVKHAQKLAENARWKSRDS